MIPKILWLTGSAIFLILGTLHLYYTFFTTRLNPRNQTAIDEMKNSSLELTRQTTAWKAWIGFNASHSAGAIFLGLVNGLLAARYFYVIENSFLLSFLTIASSVFYLWLAKKYWFAVPFYGLLIATCCFLAAPIVSFLL
ncbi:MAG TPA: hypothetical protein VFI06_12415 [Chitinophagaceae bacterium]|nr:hypothetical protein [Chitinophagaceae bacterium]